MLGEVLFDAIGGEYRLGGAPANTAVQFAQLSRGTVAPAMVSARGDDDLGRRLVRELAGRGVQTRWVQTNGRPTGVVGVTINDAGEPEYSIADNAAWDSIAWTPDLDALARDATLVVFGTLAQRSEESRDTIRRFLKAASGAQRVCDLNLRAPFDDDDTLLASLRLATAVKASLTELNRLVEMLGIHETSDIDEGRLAQRVRQEFGLRFVVVTRGERGTLIASDEGVVEGEPVSLTEELSHAGDSVGAGDAALAAVCYALHCGRSFTTAATHANRVGAFVAGRAGATPELPLSLLRSLDGPDDAVMVRIPSVSPAAASER